MEGIVLPPVRKRRSLPRAMRVALTLSKGTVTFLIILLVALLAGSFALGMAVGMRVEKQPALVERAVEKETPKPVAVATETENVPEPQPAAAEIPAKIEEKPKLNITVGPPDDATAFGIQIGAYPDLGAAEASLDARVAAVAMYPIYIVPAEIKGKGVWHRVRIGTFKTRADAEKARTALPENIANEAMVVSYK
jgi:cell division septation protein DedD